MTNDPQQRNMAIGALAGLAIGWFMLRSQGYDFSDSNQVSRAIGAMLGYMFVGALIGRFSGGGKSGDKDSDDSGLPDDEAPPRGNR